MPPKCKFTKEEITLAALEIVRESGASAVTARAVAARLYSSPKVIFGLFENMEELQSCVFIAAEKVYRKYLSDEMTSGRYPVYKASGMAYIRFAKEETELFKLLFMQTRTKEESIRAAAELEEFAAIIQKNTGLSHDRAVRFHLEMWVYVHGFATMYATSYLDWEWKDVEDMITDAFTGLRHRFLETE